MSKPDEKIIAVDREVLRREYEEHRRQVESQPHHQKCSWCENKPIRAVAPTGVDGEVDDSTWVSACKDHLDLLKGVYDGIKGSKQVDIITENDPAAAKFFDALGGMVQDHVTGDSTARHAEVDFGVKCDLCSRSNIVLVKVADQWHLGCAYAIGQGLCTNYVVIGEDEATRLTESRSVVLATELMGKRMR